MNEENKNKPAFPIINTEVREEKYTTKEYPYVFSTGGLSKRELIALENHAQLIRFVVRKAMTSEDAAKLAISHADALLLELAKETK